QCSCLTHKGFIAFDAALNEEVLIIPYILCHLGDSPMHAEVTNTTNPTGTLNPCHVCNLTVESKAQKQSETYVCQFVGVDYVGEQHPLPMHDWEETHALTEELWELAHYQNKLEKFKQISKKNGICDSLN
ncbi:hypothetical protein CROQUDRAFT_17232, partial [Cronartium quercuum f. sp. fusiforme G11]